MAIRMFSDVPVRATVLIGFLALGADSAHSQSSPLVVFTATRDDTVTGRTVLITDGTTAGTSSLGTGLTGAIWTEKLGLSAVVAGQPRQNLRSRKLNIVKPDGTQITNIISGPNVRDLRFAGVANGRLFVETTDPFNSSRLFAITEDGSKKLVAHNKTLETMVYSFRNAPWIVTGSFVNPGTAIKMYSYEGDNLQQMIKLDNVIASGNATDRPNELGIADLGDKFLFSHTTSSTGMELWVSDGTQAGTKLLKDINKGTGSGVASNCNSNQGGAHSGAPLNRFFAWNGKAFFRGTTPKFGTELWVSDGTAAGTLMLKDIAPGALPADLCEARFLTHGDKVYFFNHALTQIDGVMQQPGELWVTDGTPEGTQLTSDFTFDGKRLNTPGFTAFVDNFLYFEGSRVEVIFGEVSIPYSKLFKLNIDTGEITPVADIAPGTDMFIEPVAYGHSILFGARKNNTGQELWISDGTSAGTHLVKDIFRGSGDGMPEQFIVTGP